MLTPSEFAVLVQILGNTLKALEGLGKDVVSGIEEATSATFTRALISESLALMLETRAMDPGMRIVALFLLYALYRQTEPSSSSSGSAVSPDHPFLPVLASLLDNDDTPAENISVETFFMARFCSNPAEVQKLTSPQLLAMFNETTTKKMKLPMTMQALRSLHEFKEDFSLPALLSLGINRRILLDETPLLPTADELSSQLFTPPYVTLDPPIFPFRPDEMMWIQPFIHTHVPLWDYSLTHPSIHKTLLPSHTSTSHSSSSNTSSSNSNTTSSGSTPSSPPPSPMKDPSSPGLSSKYPILDQTSALAILTTAVSNPLPPAQTQQLISTLELSPKYVVESNIVPANKLPSLIESNPLVAIQVLLAIMTKPDSIAPYFAELIRMDMSLHSMEVINRLARAVELPHEFLNLYITHCLQQCQLHKDKYQQTRLVRLVCVFLQSLIQNRLWDVSDLFNEVQTFCIEFSRTREAAALFALLKHLEGDGTLKVDALSSAIASANK